MYLLKVRDERTVQRDCHIPQLYAELGQLGVSVAVVSVTRRPGSGWTCKGGYAYYCCSHPQRHLVKTAVAVVERLLHLVTVLRPVN